MKKKTKRHLKYCFVSDCKNTSRNSSRSFVPVPRDLEIRKQWWKVAQSDLQNLLKHQKTRLYCCEDHFNVYEDFPNWDLHLMMKARLEMREGVIPSLKLPTYEYIRMVPPKKCVKKPAKVKVKKEKKKIEKQTDALNESHKSITSSQSIASGIEIYYPKQTACTSLDSDVLLELEAARNLIKTVHQRIFPNGELSDTSKSSASQTTKVDVFQTQKEDTRNPVLN